MKMHKVAIILSCIMLVSGCANQSSDPLKDYNGLVIAPKTSEKSEDQTLAFNPFVISLDGSQQVNNGNFIEGEAGQALVMVQVKTPLITSYELVILSTEADDQITLAATNIAGVFAIQWKPRSGIIAAGLNGRAVQIKLQARVTDNGSMKGIVSDEKVFFLNVSRNNTQPKILGSTDLSKGVEEGQKVNYSVDIEDPSSSSSSKMPEMNMTPYIYANTEAFKADGSKYIHLDSTKTSNPEKIGENKWRFHFVIMPDALPVNKDRRGKEDANLNSVDLCFYMRAISSIGTFSTQQQICTVARYSVLTADAKWTDSLFSESSIATEVKAKESINLKFNMSTANGLGKLSLPQAVAKLKILTGTQEMICDQSTDEGTNCEIKWIPACTTKVKTISLKLAVQNELNKKSKTSNLIRSFKILPDSEACKGAKK